MNKQLTLPLFNSIFTTAEFSECGRFRFSLTRVWDIGKPKVFWLMHNPSTADHVIDDPTIRRCVNYSKDWGYGGLIVGNLSPYRSTNPEILTMLEMDELRPANYYKALNEMVKTCSMHIVAYGNPIDARMIMFLPDVKWYALKVTKSGNPCHPLYLKKDLIPVLWEPNAKPELK